MSRLLRIEQLLGVSCLAAGVIFALQRARANAAGIMARRPRVECPGPSIMSSPEEINGNRFSMMIEIKKVFKLTV
jgi:hypothetical protein